MRFLVRHPDLSLFGVPILIFVGMLVMLEVGRRAGLRRHARDPGESKERLGAVEGAIFGLLGLLIAFTFAGAMGRYDRRRELVVQEANVVGDAWARLDALPPETQPAIRDGMRRYVEARLETYRLLPDLDAALAEVRRSEVIQDEIWKSAIAACATPEGQRVTMLVLPALDTAFDMTLVRTMTALHHPPGIVFVALFVLALAGALLAGYGMAGGRKPNWTYAIGFAVAISLAVYVILEIEFPRLGLIRVDAADDMLKDLLAKMK